MKGHWILTINFLASSSHQTTTTFSLEQYLLAASFSSKQTAVNNSPPGSKTNRPDVVDGCESGRIKSIAIWQRKKPDQDYLTVGKASKNWRKANKKGNHLNGDRTWLPRACFPSQANVWFLSECVLAKCSHHWSMGRFLAEATVVAAPWSPTQNRVTAATGGEEK